MRKEEVPDRAFALGRAPEVHPLSTNRDKHFVKVPPIIGSWSEASELARIFSSGLEHPPPDRFIRYVETSPGQRIFHVPEAQREPAIEPNGVVDDFSREAVAPGSGGTDKRFVPSSPSPEAKRAAASLEGD